MSRGTRRLAAFAALLLLAGAPSLAAAQGPLGQLLNAAVGALGGGATYTNTSGPLCAKLPAAGKALLGAVKAPPADALCPLLLDSKGASTCELGALIEWGLGSTSNKPLGCSTNSSMAATPPGEPEAFADLRPLPAGAFANSTELFEAEGATYFWLYRLVQNLEAHLGCFLRDGTAFQPPPGWDLVSMLSITEPVSPATAAAATAGSDAGSTDSSAGGSAGGGSGGGAAGGSVALPFAAVLLQRAAGQLVVAVRGTMTGPEWLLDFSYNQTEVPQLPGLPVHAGFASVFEQLWPGVERALAELAAGDAPAATQVFIAGHSLGAGVSTLLSLAAQNFLDAAAAGGAAAANGSAGAGSSGGAGGGADGGSAAAAAEAQAAVVGALLVAPPNAGSPQFVEEFNQRVNARRLAMEYDIVPQAFCTPQMPACAPGRQPGALGGLLAAMGVSVIPTNQPGDASSWPYARIGGSLVVPAAGMPQDAASWPALADIQLCWAGQFLWSTHICSYACFTSRFAPEPASQTSQCWLSAKPDGAPGSQCPTWPADYPQPKRASL